MKFLQLLWTWSYQFGLILLVLQLPFSIMFGSYKRVVSVRILRKFPRTIFGSDFIYLLVICVIQQPKLLAILCMLFLDWLQTENMDANREQYRNAFHDSIWNAFHDSNSTSMSINKFTVSTAATLLHILETYYIMQILDSLSSTIPHTSVPQDDTSFKGEIKVLETDYIVKYNTTYNRLWKQTTLCKFWRFSSWVGWGLVSSLASASLQLSSSLFFLVSCWEYLCLLPSDCALAKDLFLPPSED